MRILNYFCILLLAVFIISCGKKSTDDKTNVNTTNPTGEAVKYKDKDLVKTYKGCKTDDKSCTYMRLKWVELTDTKYKDTINLIIDKMMLTSFTLDSATKYTDIKSMATFFIEAYSNFKKKEPESPVRWFVDYNVSIAYSTAKILCLKFDMTKFTGGENELHTTEYKNVNLETGKPVTLANLLKKDFAKDLNAIIEKKFRGSNNLTEKDSLTKGGLLKNELKFNNNYAITKEGIEFYYNEAEVAPKAAGAIIIKLSNEDLKELLGESSLLK